MIVVGLGLGELVDLRFRIIVIAIKRWLDEFFLISKKKILLIKARETPKVHGSEQWKKETTRQKQPLIYSNRRNKIRKGRTIRETPTTRPIKEGLLAKL